MQSSTVAAAFVVNMLEGARMQGYNVDRILLDCGISPVILRQPKARITFQQLSRLSHALVALLDDEAYGLMDRPQRRNTYRLCCYSAIHAATIGEAMACFRDFMNIMENSLSCVIQEEPGGSCMRLMRHANSRIVNNYAIEQILLTSHRTLCWMANRRIPILRVELDYPAPAYHEEFRYVFYGAPILFRQRACSILLGQEAMQLANVQTAQTLETFLQHVPLTLLTQTTEQPALSGRIRNWLERSMIDGDGACSIELAAEQFHLHPQALRRQLKREQTSYQDIKMETRRDLAVHMLSRNDQNVEQVAFQLGFSEPSAFIRAFKAWTGMTPLAFRKMSC